MVPVYFPFTCISTSCATTLASYFKQTAVYQPGPGPLPGSMEESAEKGIIDIRTPVTGDAEKLETLVRDYRAWADLHKDTGLGFFKSGGESIPFYDETTISKIRGDIKKKQAGKSSEERDPLLEARLFLRIAQEFDMQNEQVANELEICSKMEKNLLSELMGKALESDPVEKTPSEDPGTSMTAERIAAWLYMLGHDPDGSNLFVTDSRSIFEYIIDKAPDLEKIIQPDCVPVLDKDKKTGLSFYQANETPPDFFGRLQGKTNLTLLESDCAKYENTIFAIMDI